jgi:CubicO group peptidase (beta-lactamase class C family)
MKKIVWSLAITILGIMMAATTYGAVENQSLAHSYGVNAYSIATFENDEVTFENYGNGVNERSVFELASNGKVISAYIVLSLTREGILDLDEKIASYLDSDLLTDDVRMNDITVRQLLCHTAGFSPSFELGVDKKLYSDPGAGFRYSGVGYIYLQSVIENVTGMTMEQAARHYVFEPLGMNNSTFEDTETITPYMNLSSAVLYALAIFLATFIVLLSIVSIIGKITKFRFYSFKKGLLICIAIASVANVAFLLFVFVSKVVIVFFAYLLILGLVLLFTRKNNKIFYASMPVITAIILILGFAIPAHIPVTNDLIAKEANCAYTLKSTSEDMTLFCGELVWQYNDGNEIMQEMFTRTVDIDDVNSWGLGIAIESRNGGETYWHSGINPGFQSLLVLYPQQDKYIVVLTGSDNGLDFAKDVVRNYLGIDGIWNIQR